ncbi:MAG: sigma-54-dependent Fis family transcriptional regulator [Gemmatimonadales bacterium]|nr:MAG: sigma-54-dependent Fis family transcriptional regulator [Gemmatimonadales bacterium]
MSRTSEGTRATGAAPRILIVEDEEIIRELLVPSLREEGFIVDAVASGEEALKRLESTLYDVVLLDLNLPGMHGMNVLSAAPATQTDAQFVVMTAFGTVDTAVEAMKLGAFDYVNKPFRTEELLLVLRRALEEAELRREVAHLRVRSGEGFRGRMIGKTSEMRRLYDLIERVAPTRASVLVTGETGTGKELVARAIHDVSNRSRRPFVPVNCSALTATLLESELFGHRKGAFTGAIASKRGLFESAQGGTLFLDEVSTISPSTQVKLLRVLQERVVTPVGGTEPIAVDFRLVAATNEELESLVQGGGFREDLYYRLNVFPIRVPPLRERREDIPLLANAFRLRFAEENGIEAPPLLPETLSRMMAYHWPGNVRELENVIERSLILHAGARSLPFEPTTGPTVSGDASGRRLLGRATSESWDLDRLEREYILSVLDEEGGHQARAAEILGINRRTLYRKLKRYREEGLMPDASGPPSRSLNP